MTDETNIYRKNQRCYRILMVAGFVAVVVVFVTSLCWGNYKTTPTDVWVALMHPDANPQIYKIITLSRLPRLLASVLVGASLSVAGLTYQEIFFKQDGVSRYFRSFGRGGSWSLSLNFLWFQHFADRLLRFSGRNCGCFSNSDILQAVWKKG